MSRRVAWGVVLLVVLLTGVGLHAAAPPPRRAFALADLRQAQRLEAEAYRHAQAGRFAQALRCDGEALALRRRWQGEKHHQVQGSRVKVERWRRLADLPSAKQKQMGEALRRESAGYTLHGQGRYKDAEKSHRQALAIHKEMLGEQHPDTARSYNNVASYLKEQGKAARALPLFEKALAICKEVLGERHLYTATSYYNVADCLQEQGKAAQALPLHEKALAICKEVLGERHPLTAASYGGVAICLVEQGKAAQALPLFEKALAIHKEVLGERHPSTANSYNNVAGCLQEQGKAAQALPLLEKALALRKEGLGERHPDTAHSYYSVASCLKAQGKAAQALPLYEKALALRKEVFGEGHPSTAQSYNDVALCLQAQGKAAQALPLYEKALAICKEVLGEQHPNTATTYNNVASCLSDLGRPAQALPLFDKALAIRKEALGERHPSTANSYNDVALCLHEQGKAAQVLPLLEKALAICKEVLGERHPHTATSYNNVAGCLSAQGKLAQALPLLEKALAIRKEVLGERHPDTASSYNDVASCLQEQGKAARALPLFEKALATRKEVLGERHPGTASSYNNVALCLQAQGKAAQALPLLEKALAIRKEALGEQHPNTAGSYNNMASCLWKQGRRREAVRLWQAAAPAAEAARVAASASGFDRAQFAGARFSTHAALAAGLARLGWLRRAFRHAEADLARGLLDALADGDPEAAEAVDAQQQARRLDERLLPLLGRSDLPADQAAQRDELVRQRQALLARVTQAAAEASRRRLLPVDAVQRHLAADEALVLWVDVDALGEHWGCVLRRHGPPAWQPIKGSGPAGAWTEQDRTLMSRLYLALSVPGGDDPAALASAFRKQRMGPLEPHLQATTDLPAVRRLLVVPTRYMAWVPVEILSARHEVSYVSSGTLLARMREKHRALQGSVLLALGDPAFDVPKARLPEPPDHGLLLVAVLPGGSAARAGLRSGDVLLRYGERRLSSLDDLKQAITGDRAAVRVWREGKEMDARLNGGALGVSIDRRPAAEAIRARQGDLLLAQRGTGHAALPGTRWEVQAIARLLPQTTTLLGSQASEQELDRLRAAGRLKQYRLLHLATHGEADKDDPDRSALILAQDRLPDALKQVQAHQKVYDGRLTVKAIRDSWQLDADLVVLSACQTALGRQLGGEGLLGLAQAFLQKGARSVVVSRWKVDDAATALLMLRFYENLLGKREELKSPLGRAAALQEAKTWLRGLPRKEVETLVAGLTHGEIRGTIGPARKKKLAAKAKVPEGDRPYSHPYYWAAFVLIGDPD
jgi:tetratricopeptide (TPR) repeat protein